MDVTIAEFMDKLSRSSAIYVARTDGGAFIVKVWDRKTGETCFSQAIAGTLAEAWEELEH